MSLAVRKIGLLQRHFVFAVFIVVTIVVFWRSIENLLRFSLTHDYASYVFLIAPVSLFLIYLKRKQIFSAVQISPIAGAILFLAGTAVMWIAARQPSAQAGSNEMSLIAFLLVIVWLSGFIFCYGTRAYAAGRFPLLFLLLLVPIPEVAVEKVTFLLQAGSAAVAYGILQLFSVPVFKQGFILRLPNLDIEVAKQCSGIRSSLVLFITALIVGELALRSTGKKAFLVLSTVPILILKNGIRIVAISLLSIYVSRKFLHGWLHTSGGILFYLLGLAILIPIVTALRRSDREAAARFPRVDVADPEHVTSCQAPQLGSEEQ